MFKDTHPLKYRFNKGNVTLPISDLKDKIQLSASTAFFNLAILEVLDLMKK